MDVDKPANDDPIRRNALKDALDAGLSPMEPPDAYEPPAKEVVPYEQLHPALRRLVDDHRQIVPGLEALAAAAQALEAGDASRDATVRFVELLVELEDALAKHHRLEERRLFPLLHTRLLAAGEHSASAHKRTGVDVLESDHVRAMHHVVVAAALAGVSTGLPDERSRQMALRVGIAEATALVDLMRLHVFREENIMFGLAQKHLTTAELDDVALGAD